MEIVKVPNKILSRKTKLVPADDIKSAKYAPLIEAMRQKMIEAKGVGLAANQVDEDLSIFVVEKKMADKTSRDNAELQSKTSLTTNANTVAQAERGSVRTNERMAAEGIANRGVQVRGQDFINERQRETNAAGGKPPPGSRRGCRSDPTRPPATARGSSASRGATCAR